MTGLFWYGFQRGQADEPRVIARPARPDDFLARTRGTAAALPTALNGPPHHPPSYSPHG